MITPAGDLDGLEYYRLLGLDKSASADDIRKVRNDFSQIGGRVRMLIQAAEKFVCVVRFASPFRSWRTMIAMARQHVSLAQPSAARSGVS